MCQQNEVCETKYDNTRMQNYILQVIKQEQKHNILINQKGFEYKL